MLRPKAGRVNETKTDPKLSLKARIAGGIK